MFYIYLDVSADISSFYQISQHTNAKLRIVIITSFSVTSMIESSGWLSKFLSLITFNN